MRALLLGAPPSVLDMSSCGAGPGACRWAAAGEAAACSWGRKDRQSGSTRVLLQVTGCTLLGLKSHVLRSVQNSMWWHGRPHSGAPGSAAKVYVPASASLDSTVGMPSSGQAAARSGSHSPACRAGWNGQHAQSRLVRTWRHVPPTPSCAWSCAKVRHQGRRCRHGQTRTDPCSTVNTLLHYTPRPQHSRRLACCSADAALT